MMPMRQLAHMMALCTGLACCCLASAQVPAPIKPVFHGGPHDMLYGLSFEGANGIAVGDFGMVVESKDAGKTWSRQGKPVSDLALLSVTRKSGHCIAVGQQGRVFTSDDCKVWATVKPITDARLLAIAVNASGSAVAVGGFGAIYKSNDWGKTWRPLTPDWKSLFADGAEPHLYDVHISESGEITLVGEFELVLRSRDGGSSWAPLHKGKRSLFGLSMLDNGNMYVAGQEGLILKSNDKGGTWTELESGTKSILASIWAGPSGQVLASGIYTVLYSPDAGKTWQMDQSKQVRTGWHQSVAAAQTSDGKLNVVLAGSGGAIHLFQR